MKIVDDSWGGFHNLRIDNATQLNGDPFEASLGTIGFYILTECTVSHGHHSFSILESEVSVPAVWYQYKTFEFEGWNSDV